jgi:site-specific recombinase XerD
MNSFNVKEAIEQSLLLLEQSGVSKKTIKEYRVTGFGSIIRHFNRLGVHEINAEMLDSFVLEQRVKFEQGEFSEWKWRLVRRGSEILKYYDETGTVDLDCLRPWDPVLRKPRPIVEEDIPTHEQLADPDDIFALVWRVKQELRKALLTEKTIRNYTDAGLKLILRKHSDLGLVHYSEPLTSEMVSEVRSKYEQGLTSRVSYQNLRKASFLLAELYRTGKITFSHVPNWGLREPTPEFAKQLQYFCDNATRTGILAESTVKTAKSAIRTFIFEMEARGKYSFDTITLPEVSDIVTHIAKQYTGGLHSAIFSVRAFLRYLYENKFTPENLSIAIPEMIARRKTFREGFTESESMRLLEEPDRETDVGKRDYAIMLLASQTGLRACDIVNLKRKDIDWWKKEIRIVQTKTKKPLYLPLETESGNAIAEYLLNARPKSDLPYVFLCHTGVLRPIKNRSASAIVTRHLRRSRISSDIPRRGFHSFRRSFGTNLLQNEISIELLRQLMGLSKIDSAKPYLSVNEQELKSCALGLVTCENGGEYI